MGYVMRAWIGFVASCCVSASLFARGDIDIAIDNRLPTDMSIHYTFKSQDGPLNQGILPAEGIHFAMHAKAGAALVLEDDANNKFPIVIRKDGSVKTFNNACVFGRVHLLSPCPALAIHHQQLLITLSLRDASQSAQDKSDAVSQPTDVKSDQATSQDDVRTPVTTDADQSDNASSTVVAQTSFDVQTLPSLVPQAMGWLRHMHANLCLVGVPSGHSEATVVKHGNKI